MTQDLPTPSLPELFAIDPLNLTRDDSRIDQMVAALRAQRQQFKLAEAEGRAAPRQPRAAAAAKQAKPKIDTAALKDLELDL